MTPSVPSLRSGLTFVGARAMARTRGCRREGHDGAQNEELPRSVHTPTAPPSFLVMTIVADRGRAVPPSGQWLPNELGSAKTGGVSSPGAPLTVARGDSATLHETPSDGQTAFVVCGPPG
jgi:hypothetical protein